MCNYIGADIRRVLHKPSFLGAIGTFAGLFALAVFIYFNPTFTAELYVTKISIFLSFFPLIVGLFVFLSVYADDFKCRSMQVAIGYGIPRGKIVLGKLLESAVLLFGVAAGMAVLILAAPILLGLAPSAGHLELLALTVAAEMRRTMGYIALASVSVFLSQNAVNGIIFYVLLSSKTVYIILTMLLGQEFLTNMIGDLTKYLYTTQLYTAKGLFVQHESFWGILLLAVGIYVVGPTILSAIAFHKKELEF